MVAAGGLVATGNAQMSVSATIPDITANFEGVGTATPSTSASISAIAEKLGELWGIIADEGEVWSEIADEGETWTEVSAGSETWTTIIAGSETWTDVSAGNETWSGQ